MSVNGIKRLFSRRCCGGPVLVLAAACAVIGTVFVLLSAVVPGVIFVFAGVAAVLSCLAMGYRKCAYNYRLAIRGDNGWSRPAGGPGGGERSGYPRMRRL